MPGCRTRTAFGSLRTETQHAMNRREPIERLVRQHGVNAIHPSRASPPGPGRPLPATFEEFFTEHHPRAVRLAWLLTRSESAAEDIAQESLLATCLRFDELDEPAAFLSQVVVNQCRSWQRRAMTTRRVLAGVQPPEDVRDASEDVEVLDAVARLSHRQQVVIVARYWGGWSEKEIAAALECRPGTVKSLGSRAMEHLRRELDR